MPLLQVKERFQITLPAKLRKVLHLKVGDIIEVDLVDNALVLRPRELVKRRRRSAAGKKWEEMLVKSHSRHPVNVTEEEAIQASEETRQKLFQEKHVSHRKKKKK